ncbi:hypothetical protein I4U23_011410 [Adineta vaga]|nr:hypothetical protein I4U23_011410 [Adineta vaga]
MYQCNINLVDLPVEILYCIFYKLDNIDVLYSFFGINNQRLESIVENEIFSNILDITTISNDTTMFNRFSTFILPQICSNVKCLIVDSLSIEHIIVLLIIILI